MKRLATAGAIALALIAGPAAAAQAGPAQHVSVTNPKAKAALCKHNKHLAHTRYCGVKRPAPAGGWGSLIPTPTYPGTAPLPGRI